ncbi:HAMP domain-containing histidine kinase [Microbulbifer agarilyticus]|uniref:sensor histidine kinase n=1 Tax=Microbulbifer agarilyticus TaxID=260552 RepID=UPI001C9733BF|nr:HAMP domain-containing sensor histidine kinase [Microbulbifer agarilyticus]MBY6212854.1 HAMP domain-containing histidine kinase [Microbulbifer agarilyticus]
MSDQSPAANQLANASGFSTPSARATETIADTKTNGSPPPRQLRLRQRDLLKIYAWYRVAMSLVLLGLFISGISRGSVGTLFPALYLNTAISYSILNIAWLMFLYPSRFRTSPRRIGSILGCDILAFLLLIQASGGLDSGIGYLLLTTCAVGSLLLDRRMSAFLAAIASMAVIGQQVLNTFNERADTQDIVSAGSLGILLFTCVTALQYLSTHIQLANEKAEQQRRQAARLQRLTQQIVAQMRTGVMVLNASGEPELINRAARQLLGPKQLQDNGLEGDLLMHLAELRHQPGITSGIVQGDPGSEIRASVTALSGDTSDSSLVFLEDNRKLTQQAQQLKLASLGRLTGSIAHEVRNPLSAINHAAELLSESESISGEDRQLTEIIGRHSERVNQIIENVMQLSRRQAPQTAMHDLRQWANTFLEEYQRETNHQYQITLTCPDTPVHARFDPNQMAQVATNLCNNAVRHSHQALGCSVAEIVIRFNPSRECAQLDFIDLGDGVTEEHKDKIFEPFFTTAATGAGLGLYIARELCESNRANLYYCRDPKNRSCFRIDFASTEQIF